MTFGFFILILFGLALQVGLIALAVHIGTGKVHGELVELRRALASSSGAGSTTGA